MKMEPGSSSCETSATSNAVSSAASAVDVADDVLVLQSQLGDVAALELLVERWHPPLWEMLHHITLDAGAADDLAQETWLSALRSLAGLREPGRFRWWLFTIARRRATDRLRHKYRSGEQTSDPLSLTDNLKADQVEHQGDSTLSSITAAELRADVVAMLQPLDVELREVLVLHYLHDWPIDEIAGALDIPAGTVKSRLHRARHRLSPKPNHEPGHPDHIDYTENT